VIKALKIGIIGLGHLGRYHAEKVAQISLAGLGMTERGLGDDRKRS
jgi:phosphoglycerate dehydrogenase-like enzyme